MRGEKISAGKHFRMLASYSLGGTAGKRKVRARTYQWEIGWPRDKDKLYDPSNGVG